MKNSLSLNMLFSVQFFFFFCFMLGETKEPGENHRPWIGDLNPAINQLYIMFRFLHSKRYIYIKNELVPRTDSTPLQCPRNEHYVGSDSPMRLMFDQTGRIIVGWQAVSPGVYGHFVAR